MAFAVHGTHVPRHDIRDSSVACVRIGTIYLSRRCTPAPLSHCHDSSLAHYLTASQAHRLHADSDRSVGCVDDPANHRVATHTSARMASAVTRRTNGCMDGQRTTSESDESWPKRQKSHMRRPHASPRAPAQAAGRQGPMPLVRIRAPRLVALRCMSRVRPQPAPPRDAVGATEWPGLTRLSVRTHLLFAYALLRFGRSSSGTTPLRVLFASRSPQAPGS